MYLQTPKKPTKTYLGSDVMALLARLGLFRHLQEVLVFDAHREYAQRAGPALK